MIVCIGASPIGRRSAAHLAEVLAGATAVPDGTAPRDAVAAAWSGADALVLCMAVGAAVRLVAPHLRDKRTDPPVVVVDDARRYAIALAGGHAGGNDLAAQVAAALGAEPVVTTASDALGMPSLDRLGARFGLRVDHGHADHGHADHGHADHGHADHGHADLAAVGAALLGGQTVTRWRSQPWPTGPLPGNVVDADAPTPPAIVVTDELVDVPRPSVVYRPASLVVGVGAARGVSADEVRDLVDAALRDARLSPLSVAALATADLKADEAGIRAVAEERGWPIVTYPSGLLADVDVPNPSAIVAGAVGTPSVAEAAALARGGTLLVPKRKTPNATVAVARLPVRGRLLIVGTGPGAPDLVAPAALDALRDAEVVVGLDQYVDRVRAEIPDGARVLASPIGDEVRRAELAVGAAREGAAVALISGGDAGVYAMASPALERAGDDIDVEVVPGITAASAAAALLGSPLGHDHCAISLSDLLTPWEVIRRRVKAAAEGDFVVTFYNPRSRGRTWQLEEARQLLAEHRKPDTPVGLVTDASRPGQRVLLTTLAALDTSLVDMLTVVVVGSTQTRVVGGRMVTPRGYR